MDGAPATETVSAGGAEIPALGFGTARMTGRECQEAVEAALDLGYRHLDTAQMYDNEDAVGAAIAASDVPREECFVVTKVHPDNLAADDVDRTTRASLDRLDLESVDLLLIHGPREDVPLEETLGAMNELQAEGLVEHVGVSNFPVDLLDRAREISATPIVADQVKYHPYHRQDELLAYCIDHGICLTGYSPLAQGAVPGDERLEAIGADEDATAAQVALAWQLQQPFVATIPKAASREHVAANREAVDVTLDEGAMRAVFDLGGELSAELATRLELE